ncbi:hypothetical protein ACFL1K_04245 [Candidatus Omnitrophota bacterium]
MQKEKLRVLEYTLVMAAVFSALVFFLGREKQNIDFCRDVLFARLINGRQSVAKFIAWEDLKALGADMAPGYAKLPNEKERNNYKRTFITGFSLGFKQEGGSLQAFTNWRIYAKDSQNVIIAADYPRHKKTLLFTLSKGKERKLVALEWTEMK